MLPIRVAVAARSFHQPLKRAVQTARETGAQGLQIDAHNELKPGELSATGRRQFLHLLEENGLTVASLAFPMHRPLYELEGLDTRLDALKAALQFAFELKAGVVATRVGRIPGEVDGPAYKLLVEVTNDLARHANRVGAVLAITPSNDTPDAVAAFLKSITEGPVGVSFDPAVFVLSGHSPTGAARTLHDVIVNVQARDAIRDVDGSGVEVPLGRGEVEWDELLAVLFEAGYKQWLTVERTQGNDQTGDVARAVQFLRRVGSS